MRLIDHILENYIKIIKLYIQEKETKISTLIKIFMPQEAALAQRKKESAQAFLQQLQKYAKDEDVSVDASMNSVELSNTLISPSFNIHKRIRSLSLDSNLPTPGIYRSLSVTSEMFIETYAASTDLELSVCKIDGACLREQIKMISVRNRHVKGSYDHLLDIIRNNLVAVGKYSYNVNRLTEPKAYKCSAREDLLLYTAIYLCALDFDRMLYVNPDLTLEQKNKYQLGSGFMNFAAHKMSVIKDVKDQLDLILNEIFRHQYETEKQFIKTLTDYALVLEQLYRMDGISQTFIDKIETCKQDLEKQFALACPDLFANYQGIIDENKNKFKKKFSFTLENDNNITDSLSKLQLTGAC